MEISENIFRAYDIRGIFDKDLTSEIAKVIGKGFGTFLGKNKKIVVGRDVRLSGKVLTKALISGLRSVGCDVVDIGMAPTPVLYFIIASMKKDGGVVVSASHNPAEWNGFKLLMERGKMCAQGTGIEEVKDIILKKKFREVKKKGEVSSYNFALEKYSEFILRKIRLGRGLKIILDTCNGTCGLIAPELLEKLGCEVITLNKKPDGRFPAHPPEPNEKTLKQLSKEVKEKRADFGVGFDGDGDRAVFVDDKGRILSGDISSIIFVKNVLKRKKRAKIVFDVCCSSALEEFIKTNGGIPIVNRVGRTFILNRMLKERADFAGEMSSHFYFKEIYSFDDGVFATLKMTEILSKSDFKLSEIVDSIPRYFTSPVKKIKCPDEHKFEVVEKLKSKLKKRFRILDIDGIKVFDDGNWFLIRPSNTEPMIKINAEAKTRQKLKDLLNLAEKLVKKEIEK